MKYIYILLIAILIISCTKEVPLGEGKYRVDGEVNGLDNGEIYLSNYPEFVTIKVENGKFQIEKELNDPASRIYLLKDTVEKKMKEERVLNLLIEPTVMNLTLEYDNFSKSKLTGSSTQDDKYHLDSVHNAISSQYQKELDEFDAIREKYYKAYNDGASEDELEAIKYEDNQASEKLDPMWTKQREATLNFIKDNPTSYFSVSSFMYLINELKYKEAKAILDSFDPEHLNTEIGQQLITEVDNLQKGVPGAIAGNFDTKDINGNRITLADFKGKYLLIDFWASWCIPCRKGNPHLIDIFNKYNSKGLEILGVADDDRDESKWKKAVEKDNIGIWHHVLRGSTFDRETMKNKFPEKDISDGYNIRSLPTKILVDPKGVIIGRYGSGGGTDEDMDRDLAELF